MRDKALSVILKVGLFLFLAYATLYLFAWFALGLGYVIASVLGTFAAGAVANALAMRVYEHRGLTQIGLGWTRASVRNLLCGLVGGVGAGLCVTALPLLMGAATLEEIPQGGPGPFAAIFTLVMILFGAFGEEMMFRGYGFQVLMAALGPFATILPVSVLFALVHAWNPNVSAPGLVNTGLWGIVLGFAFWRSGDLWLAIGLHAGWNWTLPLLGANLSGLTIKLTGYDLRWNIAPLWSGGAYGPEGGLLTTAILVVLFLWLLWKAPVQRQTPYLLRDQWDPYDVPGTPSTE